MPPDCDRAAPDLLDDEDVAYDVAERIRHRQMRGDPAELALGPTLPIIVVRTGIARNDRRLPQVSDQLPALVRERLDNALQAGRTHQRRRSQLFGQNPLRVQKDQCLRTRFNEPVCVHL